MKLNDWVCDVCGYEWRDRPDTKRPPIHCRKQMRKIYTVTPAIWKTPGLTRGKPFPEKKESE